MTLAAEEHLLALLDIPAPPAQEVGVAANLCKAAADLVEVGRPYTDGPRRRFIRGRYARACRW